MKLLKYFINFSLCLLPFDVSADWILGKYNYRYGPDVSQTEACKEAERRAKVEALKSAKGEMIFSQDNMICTEFKDQAKCLLNKHTWSAIDGLIIGTRNKRENVSPSIEGYSQCEVTIEVNIDISDGRPDPSFDLGIKLNNVNFREGESLKIFLSPTQPMYINAFQFLPYISPEEQVTRIFPNSYDKNSFFDKSSSIPTSQGAAQYYILVEFPSDLKNEKEIIDEYLMVLATKSYVKFRETYSLEEFNKRLSEIPRQDRRIIKKSYLVVQKK